jgi:hypothetical protein
MLGRIQSLGLFCYKSAETLDVLLEPWFIDGLSMHANENAKKKYAKNCCINMSPEDNNCPFILSYFVCAFQQLCYTAKGTQGKSQGKTMCL